MTTVVTGFTPEGYEEYGREFIETFENFWPRSIHLVVYTWEPTKLSRGEDLPIPWECVRFLDKHAENDAARGRVYRTGMRWKAKEIEQGYSFRYDAWKFSQMAFYTRDAMRYVEDGVLVWMDADVVTFKQVPEGFVESLLGDAVVAYLGRRGTHSETGFVAFRLPYAERLINEWADLYATGRIFALAEWHSAHAFDIAKDTTCMEGRDLTPGGRGHVWFQSPLGKYMDHRKGPRKALGRSPERREV